jgi:hypothetical protein
MKFYPFKLLAKKIIITSILMLCYFSSYSQIQTSKTDLEKELGVGIYIDNVYNIDYINSTYEVVFYLWANSYGELYEINNTLIDVDKSIEIEIIYEEMDSTFIPNIGPKFNYLAKIRTKMLNETNIASYPFDNWNLNLNIEFLGHYKGEKNIIIDKKNSLIKPNFIDKWKLVSADSKITSVEWSSNFGDVRENDPSIDALHASLILARDPWKLYWKLFLVLFISFFISSLNIFLPNKRSEEKFALLVGSLFTAIGNKYITESYLPFSDTLNLSDSLHIVTFLFISIYIIFAIYEQRWKKIDNLKNDIAIYIITIICYIGTIGITTFYFINLT